MKQKKALCVLMVFCFVVSMLLVNPAGVHAAVQEVLLSADGSINPDGEVRHPFTVNQASKISIQFTNCSGGEYEFEVVDANTGDDVYDASGYAGAVNQVYKTRLDAGDYILVIQEEDDVFFDYSVTINAEISEKTNVKSVKLNKTKMTLGIGQEYQLRATINPYNATNRNIFWESSDPTVVSVDDEGEIEGEGYGQADITATVDGKTATCTVTVMRFYLEINKGNTRAMATDYQYIKNYKKGKWSSSNSSVVKVDKKGKIKGLKHGSAKITLNISGKKHVMTVYVYDKAKLKSVSEKKLKSLVDNPDTLVIDEISYSGTLRVTMYFHETEYDGDYEDGKFVGYYEKGRFKYFISD